MKSFLTILKYASLVILLMAMTFGYLFFRVWQKNERPEIIESNWEQSEILLGHSSTLNLTVKVPWHRELNSATPVGSPDFLLPVRRLGKVEKGSLDLTGHRTWYLQIPFVATDTQSLEGQTAAFPVKSTERVSPTTINLDLPELSIVLPSDIPDDFKDPNIFLTEKPPEESEETSSNRPEKKPWWPWVVGAVVLLAVLIYILKRTGVIKTTPAWEKALGRLESLTKDSPPPVYYSKLTDILKGYTADRYSVRARAKTSAEFIRILQDLPAIPNEYLTELPAFASLADAVKFADHVPPAEDSDRSVELIRSFIKATIPVETNQPSDD
ncbi:MAG: hypothetical protein ACON38_15690 [Akkermansiaceae bacterium]